MKKLLAALAIAMTAIGLGDCAEAQTTTISALPPAVTPLNGTEVYAIVQSGVTKKVGVYDTLSPYIKISGGNIVLNITGTTQCLQLDSLGQLSGTGAPCSVSAVTSVFGRVGVVTAQSGDYDFSQIGNTPTTIAGYGITDAVSLTGAQTLSNKTLTNPTINAGALSGTFTGTPILTLTNAVGLPLATGVTGLAAGGATFLNTPSSANLRAFMSDETGSGLLYFQGGALGTVAAGSVLTNATGLPLTTGITGTLAIANGGTGGTTAGIPLITSLGAITGTASSSTFLAGDGTWKSPTGSGTVTAGTTGQVAAYTGSGTTVAGIGPGTTTTLLHGNAAGQPSFSAVSLANDVTGLLATSNLSNTQNSQTGTSYAIQASDGGKTVIGTNASAQAYTIASAATTGFTVGFGTRLANNGVGTITLTATTSLFPNGLSAVKVLTGQAFDYESNSTNYNVGLMGLPPMPASTVLGQPVGATTDYPQILTATQLTAIPNIFTSSLQGMVPSSGGGTSNFLRADGTWAVPPGTGGGGSVRSNYVAGNWYNVAGTGAGNGVNISATVTQWVPRFFDKAVTISNVGARVSTSSTGQNFAIALYASGSNGLPTGSALATSGNIPSNSGSQPMATDTFNGVIASAGWYWFGVQVSDATTALMSISGSQAFSNSTIGANSQTNLSGSTTNPGTEYKTTGGTFGTWPTNPTIAFAGTSGNTVPMVQFKIGSVP